MIYCNIHFGGTKGHCNVLYYCHGRSPYFVTHGTGCISLMQHELVNVHK